MNGVGPHLISARVDGALNVVFVIFAAIAFIVAALFVFVLTVQLIFGGGR